MSTPQDGPAEEPTSASAGESSTTENAAEGSTSESSGETEGEGTSPREGARILQEGLSEASVRVAHFEAVGNGHLRCMLADPLDRARLPAIAFRAAETPLGRFLAYTGGTAIHVAGHLRRDGWRGGDAVQLVIDDAAPATYAG